MLKPLRLLFFMTLLLFSCSNNSPPKVYDCFLFFNEFEILELRLNELYDAVDKFVLVECKETFRGNPKPLYFKENQHLFKKFADKIIYVCVDKHIETSNPWEREAFQRNQIIKGLKGCKNTDIVLISDVDEILKRSAIQEIVKELTIGRKKIVCCEQPMYRFYLNQRDPTPWAGTIATTFKRVRKKAPDSLRLERNTCISSHTTFHYPMIKNAGWHFTSMGGLNRVVQKYEAFSHAEADIPENKQIGSVEEYLNLNCFLVPIDSSFPDFVLKNMDLFQSRGFIYEDRAR